MGQSPAGEQPRRRIVAATLGAAVLIAAIGFALWWPWTDEAPPAAPAPVTGAAAQPEVVPAAVPVAPAAPGSAAAVAPQPPATGAARAKLQARLDALAQAYERGDARAIERAIWPNHAVVRPDGERLERRELLVAWAEEWEALGNRDLKFYVERVDAQGASLTAVWTILLTADVQDAHGETQHMMINGKQQATWTGSGDAEMLEGPIVYLAFERTLNGFPWPLE